MLEVVNITDVANCLTQNGTRDPYLWQDGIAPQCAVSGIDPPIQNVRGRAYIPPTITIPNETWYNKQVKRNWYG